MTFVKNRATPGLRNHLKKCSFLILLLIIFLPRLKAQTTLSAGDIAFLGYYRQSSTNTGFSFVALRDITQSTIVYFTDAGVDDEGWATSTEGFLRWTVGNTTGSGIAAGTIIHVTAPQSTGGMQVSALRPGAAVASDITGDFSTATPNAFLLGVGGDPILVFQTKIPGATFATINNIAIPIDNINFITGITTDYNTSKYNPVTHWNQRQNPSTPVSGAQESVLPPGLTNGVHCISLAAYNIVGIENYARYNDTTRFGTLAELRNKLNDYRSWVINTPPASIVAISPTSYSTSFTVFPDVLPVTFGTVEAHYKNDALNIQWQTLSETSNDYFEIQVSKDGQNFSTIQSIVTKAQNGNSSLSLTYETSINMHQVGGLLGLGILTLLSFATARRKKIQLMMIIVIAGILYGCTKSKSIEATDLQKIYLRIAQVDKDGSKSYSKTILVHNNP